MAEAHQAVAFTFSVTQEGLQWNVDARAFMAILHSGVHYWRVSYSRVKVRLIIVIIDLYFLYLFLLYYKIESR